VRWLVFDFFGPERRPFFDRRRKGAGGGKNRREGKRSGNGSAFGRHFIANSPIWPAGRLNCFLERERKVFWLKSLSSRNLLTTKRGGQTSPETTRDISRYQHSMRARRRTPLAVTDCSPRPNTQNGTWGQKSVFRPRAGRGPPRLLIGVRDCGTFLPPRGARSSSDVFLKSAAGLLICRAPREDGSENVFGGSA